MSATIEEFLKKAREDSKHSTQTCVVIGSEACDLDSVVSAVVLAHYLSTTSTPSTRYLPLLNCQREDITLRPDIVWLLNHLQIDYNRLVHYPEEFDPSDCPDLQVILVDHNVPDDRLSSLVIEIVDHREDAEVVDCPRVIEMVGSCSTLVAERITADKDYVITGEIATLLLSAILADTNNLTIRSTDKDQAMVSRLKDCIDVSTDDLYNKIIAARYNIADLSTLQLLRSDYKQCSVGAFTVGFCTVRSLITKLVTDRERVDQDVALFCGQKGLHLLVLLGIQIKPLQKQIALYQPHSVSQDLVDSVAAILEANSDLQVERVGEGMFDGIVFEQGKLSITRKQILPLVTKCLRQGDLEDSYESGGVITPDPILNQSEVKQEVIETSIPVQAVTREDNDVKQEIDVKQEVEDNDIKQEVEDNDVKQEVEDNDIKQEVEEKTNDEEDSETPPSGSLLQLDSISARLGESMDSFALAQDSDHGGHSPGSSRTSSTYNILHEEDEDRPPPPLEPIVNIVSPLGNNDDPPVLQEELPVPAIPEYTPEEESQETRIFRTIVIDGEERRINLKFIEQYRPIVQHGGYVGTEQTAVIVISACYLPSKQLHNYPQLISQIFFYVLSVVDKLVVDDYILVYLHSGGPRNSMPGIQWFHKFYKMIDRRLRKNVKHVYVVHPTFWVKTMLRLARPFISRKFYRKVHYVSSLKNLSSVITLDTLFIPDAVQSADQTINPDDYRPDDASS